MSGANSLLETGNMGFGMRAVLHPIASFPFPGKRGLCFLGHFFRLVLSYSRRIADPPFEEREGGANRKRVALCRPFKLTTNCAAGSADAGGETSHAQSAKSASLPWKSRTDRKSVV